MKEDPQTLPIDLFELRKIRLAALKLRNARSGYFSFDGNAVTFRHKREIRAWPYSF